MQKAEIKTKSVMEPACASVLLDLCKAIVLALWLLTFPSAITMPDVEVCRCPNNGWVFLLQYILVSISYHFIDLNYFDNFKKESQNLMFNISLMTMMLTILSIYSHLSFFFWWFWLDLHIILIELLVFLIFSTYLFLWVIYIFWI